MAKNDGKSTRTEQAEKEWREKEKYQIDISTLTPDTWLSKEQASTIAKVSVSTVKNWYLSGKLKANHPGGSRRVMIRYQDLLDFMEQSDEYGVDEMSIERIAAKRKKRESTLRKKHEAVLKAKGLPLTLPNPLFDPRTDPPEKEFFDMVKYAMD